MLLLVFRIPSTIYLRSSRVRHVGGGTEELVDNVLLLASVVGCGLLSLQKSKYCIIKAIAIRYCFDGLSAELDPRRLRNLGGLELFDSPKRGARCPLLPREGSP